MGIVCQKQLLLNSKEHAMVLSEEKIPKVQKMCSVQVGFPVPTEWAADTHSRTETSSEPTPGVPTAGLFYCRNI